MAEVSTFKKIVAILPLFLFDIILPTVDIGTDVVLISKLYNTNYVCKDNAFANCSNKNKDLLDANDEDYCQDPHICHLENETYSCNHTGTYKICSEDPELFCTTTKYYQYNFVYFLIKLHHFMDYLGKAHWSLQEMEHLHIPITKLFSTIWWVL